MSSSQPPAPPVFIDFEGIDGSGKTTLSNRLADLLRERGIPVHHARAGGVFRSEISKQIRALTRDPRYLKMSHVTEFLLYVARDTQMIDEFIRPKLQPGNLVFSDRYLYSAITHSHHARGLPRRDVDAVLAVASRGLWPDLVVYCDVDPLTSRIRKKIQKVRDQRFGDFGRKGLMGIGFREEMRRGFLQLAEEDPDRWIVIDNANSTIEQSLDRICRRVVSLLAEKGYGNLGALVPETAVESSVRALSRLADRVAEVLAISELEKRQDATYRLFFEELDALSGCAPSATGLFISGLDTPESHALREKILDREPALVAYGLQGLRSPEATRFRSLLKDREPVYVARSLYGMPDLPEFTALREALLEKAPAQVVLSVRGQDTELAWDLRKRVGRKTPRELLLSLKGLDTDEAWRLRDKHAKANNFPALLESLSGLDTPRAGEWRERLKEGFLPWVLMSLRGIQADWAWALREEHVERAPKIVVKTIGRSEDPRAWRIREIAKYNVKEVLDSLSGLDCGPAWKLRMELREKWPNTAVSSLGAGVLSERAWKFRWQMLRDNPSNLLLIKHIVRAVLRSRHMGAGVLDDDDDFT